MYKGFRIKLSTMEILLIGGLLGSLVLGLWQARQLERRLEDGGRDHRHSDHHHTHH
jgi:hypothetical protein